jgi:oxygen-independent coproporphyrinogen III oxidase
LNSTYACEEAGQAKTGSEQPEAGIIIQMPLGLYISVPFCRTKCTYCNFASDVFSRAVFTKYVDRVCAEIAGAPEAARKMGGSFEPAADSIYFGGGTPTLLEISQLERVFVSIRQNFDLQPDAEITVECAPGTLSADKMEALVRCGVNRVSLGMQSFVDQEAASVGRLHKRDIVFDDIARLRAAGISNLNVDLIAGLPHQTGESWDQSLDELIATDVPHASVYMLEVDEDSRLGRELIAGGQKYHAHHVPDEDLTADMYEIACERLNSAGIQQYEISNFARTGLESKHNLKYWTRQPYLGFGVDAHSMLRSENGAVRFSNPDALDLYICGAGAESSIVSQDLTLQEEFFLGLRLNCGVNFAKLTARYGEATAAFHNCISELVADGLLQNSDDFIRLTQRGRLLSNEVFQQFISLPAAI